MNYFYGVLILSILCALNTNAQRLTYKEGYLVTIDLDTLKGAIQFDDQSLEHSCLLKSPQVKGVQELKASSVKEISLNDGSFFLSDSSIVKGTYQFVEVLVQGEASLYKQKSDFYIQKYDGKYHLLNTFQSNVNNLQKVKSIRHRGVLKVLMKDCPEVQKQIDKCIVSEESLVQVVAAYNQHQGEAFKVYKEHIPWNVINLSFGVSYQQERLSFNSSTEYSGFIFKGDYRPQQVMVPFVQANLYFPRKTPFLSFVVRGEFFTAKYYSTETVTSNGSRVVHEALFNFHRIRVPLGVQYDVLNTKNTHLYTSGGITAGILFPIKDKEYLYSWKNDEKLYYPNYEPKRSELGFWLTIGISRKIYKEHSLYIESRYLRTNGITNSDSNKYPSSISNGSLSLGYRI
ncbi:hypothetical protein GCM10023331_32320 [Algivirga pacifica]|uniref:Outer membrane protein beta-barrel domain-containing protein n=2 Tax=Algivirga pacifica TaxID=1162670 RepID=A0ABP9DGD1_9BACT